eukprot:9470800-Pyramimonas_sp.AAC.1
MLWGRPLPPRLPPRARGPETAPSGIALWRSVRSTDGQDGLQEDFQGPIWFTTNRDGSKASKQPKEASKTAQ